MAEFGSNERVALILCVVLLTASAACTEPSTPAASADTASPSTGPEVFETDPAPAPKVPDIYTINPKTEAAKLLLRVPGAQTNAELSPNGRRVVYQSKLDGPSQIFVSKADGTKQQLTQGKHGAHDPTWSPDGSQIAFASRPRKGTAADIFVMHANGSHKRRLVGTARNDGHPDWSPDGSRIAFHTRYERNTLPGGLIWVASVRTRTLTRLTPSGTGFGAVDPAWSPDGRWLAYSRFESSTINGRIPRAELWLMRPDGTHKSRITESKWAHLSQNPSWSPDGRRIAFEDSDWEAGNGRVLVIDPRTGRIRTILRTGFIRKIVRNAWSAGPSWSPRGILLSLPYPFGNGQPSPGSP